MSRSAWLRGVAVATLCLQRPLVASYPLLHDGNGGAKITTALGRNHLASGNGDLAYLSFVPNGTLMAADKGNNILWQVSQAY